MSTPAPEPPQESALLLAALEEAMEKAVTVDARRGIHADPYKLIQELLMRGFVVEPLGQDPLRRPR